jgi:hypothetical protein
MARERSTGTMSVLRKVFGPSKKEVWKQLSSELGADFREGGFARSDKVQVHVKDWTLTLDTFAVSTGKVTVIFTRMRAPYVNADGFRFCIHRKSIFTALGKMLGMQDVEVGFPEFDNAFVIKGTDEAKLRALFANEKIRELIKGQPEIQLEVRDDEGWFATRFPQGVDELRFHVVGIIKDIERLKHLYELFAEVLNHLCHMGSAYERDPGIEL